MKLYKNILIVLLILILGGGSFYFMDSRNNSIPVLAYHEVVPLPDGGNPGIYVHPDEFEKQLDALLEAGYTTLTMDQVYDHYKNKTPLPDKPLVLAFDDGYESHFDFAALELNKRGMTGTFYLIVNSVEIMGRQADVRKMVDLGMEVGSHSASHHSARNQTKEEILYEYKMSKEYLENLAGVSINHFCYPFGEYGEPSKSILKDLGYKTAVRTTGKKLKKKQGYYNFNRINVDYSYDVDKILELIK